MTQERYRSPSDQHQVMMTVVMVTIEDDVDGAGAGDTDIPDDVEDEDKGGKGGKGGKEDVDEIRCGTGSWLGY